MPLGPDRFTKSKQLGALSTTTEYSLWTNDTGNVVELDAAQFNQLTAITCSTNGFWTFDIYAYDSDGVQGDVIATLHYGTASAAGYVGDHVAFVAEDLTLDSTGLAIDDGSGCTIKATLYGTGAMLSADAEITARFAKGMTSAA